MVSSNARLLILLVEDDADTRELYAEFLRSSFDVLEAGDGHAALRVLEQQVPALVITDFSLPGMDGFELIRRMRGQPSTRQIPVLLLSGYSGRSHEQRAIEAGCDRVLEKPCLPHVLAEAAQEMSAAGRAGV